MFKKILASVGVIIIFGVFLLISYIPFNVRFSDDFEFVHGKKGRNKVFHFKRRFRNLKTVVFWDIRNDLDIKQYTLFWIFMLSYMLLAVSILLKIWLNQQWLLAVIRSSALMAFIAIMPAVLSRRFTLYNLNHVRNRKEYRAKLRTQTTEQMTTTKKIMLIISITGAILTISIALVYVIWYI